MAAGTAGSWASTPRQVDTFNAVERPEVRGDTASDVVGQHLPATLGHGSNALRAVERRTRTSSVHSTTACTARRIPDRTT